MNVDEGVFASRSELALQDLLIDVAAVVNATGFRGTSDILSGPNRNLGRLLEVFNSGNNLTNVAVWKDERI
ncbi:MAG: hypothetical protein WCD49_07685 [Candidatus Acidiferrales bacterium]